MRIADLTELEMLDAVIFRDKLVGELALVVVRVGLGSELNKKFCHFLVVSHGGVVERTVLILVLFVRIGTVLQQIFYDLGPLVV